MPKRARGIASSYSQSASRLLAPTKWKTGLFVYWRAARRKPVGEGPLPAGSRLAARQGSLPIILYSIVSKNHLVLIANDHILFWRPRFFITAGIGSPKRSTGPVVSMTVTPWVGKTEGGSNTSMSMARSAR